MKKITMGLGVLVLSVGCQTSPGKRTGVGIGVGAVVGAGLGAVIGHQSGKKKEGALIGATLGGLLGGGIGNYLDKQAKELAAIAETRRTERGIVTKLKGDILFDTGKHSLKGDAKQRIDQIAAILVKYPEDRIKIVGHTDSQGADSLNAALSVKRANTVFELLKAGGINAASLNSMGMGETQPIASNSTGFGRAQNRRVELEITVDEEAYQAKYGK